MPQQENALEVIKKQEYCNFHMKQLIRKLRDDAARETERQHIQLMGLKRRDIPKWVNRNLIDVLNQKTSPAAQRITKIAEMFREAARLSEELRLLDKDDA